MRTLDIGILIVGTEILQGFTKDTNSGYLAERLTQMGHEVKRITTVRDNVTEIIRAIRSHLKANYDIVFVCGGLGSTPDDVTLEAVAKAMDRPLTTSRKALSWIKKKMLHLHKKGRLTDKRLSEPHRRMARVPRGASVLYNKPGAAPGIVVKTRPRGRRKKAQKMIILPGVPRELKYILEEQIKSQVIKPSKERPFFKELEVRTYESQMYNMLLMMFGKDPDICIGSYPQDDKKVVLRVSGKREKVLATIDQIKEELARIDEAKGDR